MTGERADRTITSQEVPEPAFTDEEVTVVQGLINCWGRKAFKAVGIGSWQVETIKDSLEKKFAGTFTVNGFFLAIKEMVRQDSLNLKTLPTNLKQVPGERDLVVWASMYNGDSNLEACQLLGCESGMELNGLRKRISNKLGFANPYQAVAWWAREMKKAGEL